MVLNISNNTDIIRFYSEWMMKRFEEGFFSIETAKQNAVYELKPSNFELLVFQTKDPTNILPYYNTLKAMGFNMIFIITLNPYDSDIEPNLDKKQVFASLQKLSKLCGKEKIIWKYAPILFNNEFNEQYHIRKFKAMCKKISPFVSECICDFMKPYNPPVHLSLYTVEPDKEQKIKVLHEFIKTAQRYNIKLYSKCLKTNLTVLLKEKLNKICNVSVTETIPVMDLGLKNTCKGMCEYCYCGGNKFFTDKNCFVNSPLMIGNVDTSKKHIKKKCQKIS